MHPANSPHAVFQLLRNGLIVWIAILLALFALSWVISSPETVSNAFMWMLQYWWIGYLAGLVAIFVSARQTKSNPGGALVAYVLPMVIVGITAMVCYAIYPMEAFRNELLAYLPMVVVFYIIGVLWVLIGKSGNESVTRATVPPMVGGLIVLALIAVPVFNSNAYRFHEAFDLRFQSSETSGGTLTVDAVLEVRKAGEYQFQPVNYDLMAYLEMVDEDTSRGTIEWLSEKPAADSTGEFPIRMIWNHTPPAGDYEAHSYGEPYVALEVRPMDDSSEILTVISTPLRAQE